MKLFTGLSLFAMVSCLSALADSNIVDDIIVYSDAAIGLDAGYLSYIGHDDIIAANTLTLVESNLRILFDDSSEFTGFPTNDWRLIANDIEEGGSEYFAIEDASAGNQVLTVEYYAFSDAFRVRESGLVGINKGSPQKELQIHSGDTPDIRLFAEEDDRQWRIGGNEAWFIISTTDENNNTSYPFYVYPNESNNGVTARTNRVAFGNSGPKALLHVYSSDDSEGRVLVGDDYLTESSDALYVVGDAFISGTLELGSSREIKRDITPLAEEDAVDAASSLEPVRFTYKTESESQLGFIAEDVPQFVASSGRDSLRPMDFVAVLTRTVQAHEEKLSAVEEKLAEQNKRLEELIRRADSL